MRFRGGEFSTGTTGNFQPELTYHSVFVGLENLTVGCTGSVIEFPLIALGEVQPVLAHLVLNLQGSLFVHPE